MDDKFDVLKLENQLCFPLYACSKEIVKRYKPFLDEIGLTYTQLTPLLKKLEKKGYIVRERDSRDERILRIAITKQGEELKERAVEIPAKIGSCVPVEEQDAVQLFQILHRMLELFRNEKS